MKFTDASAWILQRTYKVGRQPCIGLQGLAFKQYGGPLLHQVSNINDLLTLRSLNVTDLRELEILSAPTMRPKSMPLLGILLFVRFDQVGGSRC